MVYLPALISINKTIWLCVFWSKELDIQSILYIVEGEKHSNLYTSTIPLADCYALLQLEPVLAFVAAGEAGDEVEVQSAAAGWVAMAAAHCFLGATKLL